MSLAPAHRFAIVHGIIRRQRWRGALVLALSIALTASGLTVLLPATSAWAALDRVEVLAVETVPAMSCTTGSGRPHTSSIPTLRAQVSEGAISVDFEWGPVGGLTVTSTTGSAESGSWFPFTPAANQIPDGASYRWRARGQDQLRPGRWSSWCEFTLDAQAPTQLAMSPPVPCVATASASDTDPLPRINVDTSTLTMLARVDDVNGGTTQADFEWWPKATRGISDRVGTVTTSPQAAGTVVQAIATGAFTDGTAYSWRVRGNDGGSVKPWSQWCEFVADTSVPGAPTVTADPGNDLSLAVQPAAPGFPGETAVVARPTRVTLHPADGTDPTIIGYRYGVANVVQTPDQWVVADVNGDAIATIEPVFFGFEPNVLTVVAVDRAGNESPQAVYHFRAHPAAGWWPTTGSAEPLPDVTGSGNDLTLGGGASLGQGVLTLDGTTGEATAPGPVLDTGDSFTVAAWARPADLGTDRVVAAQDGDSESAFRLGYSAADNAWCFTMTDNDAPSPTLSSACGSAPVANQWVHLAGVYDIDTSEISLYVDGVLVDTSPVAAWPASGAFTVGRALANGSATGWFAGDIADIRAWQRVMDPTGIAAMAVLPPGPA
jgi:Concanavalin A-like lectin/glucanases superfamily